MAQNEVVQALQEAQLYVRTNMPVRHDPNDPDAEGTGAKTDFSHVASDGMTVETDITYINGQSRTNRAAVARYGPEANGVTRASAKTKKHKELVEADHHRFFALVLNEFGQIIKGHKDPVMNDLGDIACTQAPLIYEYPDSFLRQLQARLYVSTIMGNCNLLAGSRRKLFRDKEKVRARNMDRRRNEAN